MSRTRAVLTALLLTSTLTLAGCSDDPEPKFAPPTRTPSPTSSASTPSGDGKPLLPEAARRRNNIGSAAFVQYFVDVLNYAQRTGDVATLADLSAPACKACAGYVQGITSAYRDGGHIEGGALALGHLRALPPDFGGDWGGFAQGKSNPQVIVAADGARKTYPGGRFRLFAYTKWQADGWVMQWMRTPS